MNCLLVGVHVNNQWAVLFLCSFLGYVDKLGVAYEAPTVATGFGAYLAQVSDPSSPRIASCCCVFDPRACFTCVRVAPDAGGIGEQGGGEQTGSLRPGEPLPQGSLLQRRPLLQPSEFQKHGNVAKCLPKFEVHNMLFFLSSNGGGAL